MQPNDQKSAFVLGLAESQGTLAVVAALLAGFSYSGFCSVTREELAGVHFLVQYAFSLSNALSASMGLFVTIVCSLCEQQGRVARSFAVLRGHEAEFEDTVHEWWKSFAQIRTNAVFVFIYSIPVFFVSMACIALIKLPPGPCIVALGILVVTGVTVFQQLLVVNENFRARILRFFVGPSSFTGFAPPSLDAEPTEEDVVSHAELRRGQSESFLGSVGGGHWKKTINHLKAVRAFSRKDSASSPPGTTPQRLSMSSSRSSEGSLFGALPGAPPRADGANTRRSIRFSQEVALQTLTASQQQELDELYCQGAETHNIHSGSTSSSDSEEADEVPAEVEPPKLKRRSVPSLGHSVPLLRPRAKSTCDGSGGTGGSDLLHGQLQRRRAASLMVTQQELDDLAIAHASGM